MNKYIILPLAALCLVAGSCAQSASESTGETAQKYLSLWMDKNHPGVAQDASGIYILEDEPGTGDEYDSESAYILAGVTIRSLSGTITSTTEEALAKQLGTYRQGNHYGAKYQAVGTGTSYAGVDAMLDGMRIGGKRTALIPSWMLTTSRYDTQKEYINACTSSTHLIYTISLEGQTYDIDKTEMEILAAYVKEHFGADEEPDSYVDGEEPAGNFYFISDITGFDEEDALESDAKVKINYTGRLLNGQVFDTTLEKVAKDAGIFDVGKTYEPVSVTMADDYSNISMSGSSSLINGFKAGLSLMQWKGQKATALFTSALGYTSNGSGNTIPAFSPLIFELEILED